MIDLILGVKLAISVFVIASLIYMIFKLIAQQKSTHNCSIDKSIQSNIGVNSDAEKLSLYKPNDFLLMMNAGEDLCTDDISFELLDYCGSIERMYYNNGD